MVCKLNGRITSIIVSFVLFLVITVTVSVVDCVDSTTQGPEAEYDSHESNFTISEEKRLTQFLLSRYKRIGRGGRPVVNTSEPTQVTFGLGLIQMDLDERNKILATSMWSRLSWTDVYMRWDPADFGGVYSIRLESDQVWLPDIMLYNTADPEGAARNALVVVFYDGTLQWIPHQIFKSSCSIDVTNFPFDRQQCHMWFGSWTHNCREIDLTLAFESGIDLDTFQSDYKDSCEWDIASSQAEKKLLPPNDTNPIAVLTFSLDLERKLVFSSYILTLPCVFLASLTLVVFCLPPDRPDRTGLAMNLFQSFLVLLLILVEAAPPTASSVPTLGVYYCFNLVIIMLSIYLSSLVVNIHRAEATSKPVPYVVELILLKGLGPLLCLSLPGRLHTNHSTANSRPTSCCNNFTSTSSSSNNNGCNHTALDDSEARRSLLTQQFMVGQSARAMEDAEVLSDNFSESEKNQHLISRYMLDIRNILNQLCQTAEKKTRRADMGQIVIMEWRQVARVLDRFFFLVYLAGIIISLIFFFPKPPGI